MGGNRLWHRLRSRRRRRRGIPGGTAHPGAETRPPRDRPVDRGRSRTECASALSDAVNPFLSEDQRDVVAFLRDPSSYGPGVDRVEVIETHASLIFIAGERVFKLKRAVAYPYLDFSTADLRRRACEAELVLNRRTAPALYEEVRGLFRGADGAVSFAPNGETLDWVVVMRRFDQALLFDALAATAAPDRPIMPHLPHHLAQFHPSPHPHFDHGGAAEMAGLADLQYRCLAAPN